MKVKCEIDSNMKLMVKLIKLKWSTIEQREIPWKRGKQRKRAGTSGGKQAEENERGKTSGGKRAGEWGKRAGEWGKTSGEKRVEQWVKTSREWKKTKGGNGEYTPSRATHNEAHVALA
jgi:hypothetical protein